MKAKILRPWCRDTGALWRKTITAENYGLIFASAMPHKYFWVLVHGTERKTHGLTDTEKEAQKKVDDVARANKYYLL